MSSERAWEPAFTTPLTPGHEASGGTGRGYAAGYSAGWAAGSRAAGDRLDRQRQEEARVGAQARAEAHDRLERALAVLEAAARTARARVAPVLEDAAEEVIAASTRLAAAVLGEELRDGDRAARTAVRRALANDPSGELVRIRLNPDDLALLGDVAAQAGADLEIPSGVELVADATLAPGDAMGDFEDAVLDARLRRALDRAVEVLGVGP